MKKTENVLIVGASDNPDRYSNKALHMLEEYGHKVHLVHPTLQSIEGHPVHSNIDIAIQTMGQPPDTITIYVNPQILAPLLPSLMAARPRRVIMNPGTEDQKTAELLKSQGIDVVMGCTLVMLRTNQF